MIFKTDRTHEQSLFPFSYRDLVEEDSDVWLYIDLFDANSFKEFEDSYSSEGQVPIEPKLMLRTIFYGLTHGIISGRKLQTACRNDNRFIVLSGNLGPDRSTFNRFINRHAKLMDNLFIRIVKVAQKMDLVNLGRIAIDGSRFKGYTGANGSMKYPKMVRAIDHIREELKKLREDLEKENSSERNPEDRLQQEIRNKENRLEKILKAKEMVEEEYKKKRIKLLR
jgi:transposase